MTRLITIFDKNLNQRVFRLFDENEIVHKIDTNLTISASSTSIDVGNNVELTGVLTDENSVPLGGMSVRILKNNVLLDTVTTNSGGVYSKTITGLDIGTYHFHTSYAGNDVYDNALSETVDVSVVGHTYAVTITADKQSILTTESVTVSGTVTRDGTGYAGQSVRIFDSGVLVDTVTTDANGDYTKTVSNLTQGTHRFSSQFDAYESSIVVVEVVEHNYSINISADNPIIQSGDTSIITATLLDATDPVIDETLSYTLTNKGTVVGSGSALTNSNGQITINYVGAGLGDIDVEVTYGSILQETFVIQDFVFYDSSSQANVSKYTPSSGLSLTFEDDHYTTVLNYDNWKTVRFADNLNLTDFEVEYDVKFDGTRISSQFATANVQSGFELNNSFFLNFSPIDKVPFDVKYDTWYHVKATEFNGTFTVKVFENDIEVYSSSQSAVTLQFLQYRVGWERGAKTYLKNISVKAL